jgi:hypothetical protein
VLSTDTVLYLAQEGDRRTLPTTANGSVVVGDSDTDKWAPYIRWFAY